MNGSLWNTHGVCQLFPPYFYSWTENIQKSSKKSDANDSKLKHAFQNQHEYQNKGSKEQAPFSEALMWWSVLEPRNPLLGEAPTSHLWDSGTGDLRTRL